MADQEKLLNGMFKANLEDFEQISGPGTQEQKLAMIACELHLLRKSIDYLTTVVERISNHTESP